MRRTCFGFSRDTEKIDALSKLYKSNTENQSYFNNNEIFVFRNFIKTNKSSIFAGLEKNQEETLAKTFLRKKLFTLSKNQT